MALAALILLPGCFTGIEGTARIKDTTREGREASLSTEQTILADALPQPPADWRPGKAFIVTDGRYDLAFAPAAQAARLHRGDTLRLIGISPVARLSGDSVTDISFSSPCGTLTHRIDVRTSQLLAGSRLPIPFTVDAESVIRARRILSGREVWTLKADKNGEKYKKVRIDDVTFGTPEYPLTVITSVGDSVHMAIESKGPSSRTFASLFSLADPRQRYPQIPDENWAKISKGQIALGMTRDECRLALGAPANLDREAAYNALIERWTYENGIYLYFTDGLLTSFRK